MNVADSERLSSALGSVGFEESEDIRNSNISIVNSCVVRQSSEDKVTAKVDQLTIEKRKNQEKIIVLMGCMVGPKTNNLEARFPDVDLFLQPQNYEPLIQLLYEKKGIDKEGCLSNLDVKPRISSFVPVSHGCDKFCAFCIIPYRRGREISREIPVVVDEVKKLASNGVKEITLLGQNVDSYGYDLPEDLTLADLFESLHEIDDIERIRFLTSHPIDMDIRIINSIASLPKVCESINLPFQSGSNNILQTMRRGYSREEYIELINIIRDKIPNVAMSADVIVGFCGESESDFEDTIDLIEEIKFDKLHTAIYSERPGTIAQRKMKDDVKMSDKQRRYKTLNDIQEKIQGEINSKLLGQISEVMIEGKRREKPFGRNRHDKIIYTDIAELNEGDIVNVKIDYAGPWAMKGEVINL
jgi:tRNA-2-methylthio-N6-dimethylallyladenosine synthase